jgi:hypothetical protein
VVGISVARRSKYVGGDRPKNALFSGKRFDAGESDRPKNATLSGERFDTGESDRTANASPCLVSGSWGRLGDHSNITKLYRILAEELTFSH